MNNKIEEFWSWFIGVSSEFNNFFENEKLLNELDSRVMEFEGITWEIGPGKLKENSLVLSPSGDKELLNFTKLIVSLAPKCEKWEFLYAKPIKKWDRFFLMKDELGNNVEINASCWKYVLLKYSDGMFDIIIKAPDIINYNDKFKYLVASFVVEGEVGEENYIERIKSIEVVNEFENNFDKNSNSIEVLSEHFNSLLI